MQAHHLGLLIYVSKKMEFKLHVILQALLFNWSQRFTFYALHAKIHVCKREVLYLVPQTCFYNTDRDKISTKLIFYKKPTPKPKIKIHPSTHATQLVTQFYAHILISIHTLLANTCSLNHFLASQHFQQVLTWASESLIGEPLPDLFCRPSHRLFSSFIWRALLMKFILPNTVDLFYKVIFVIDLDPDLTTDAVCWKHGLRHQYFSFSYIISCSISCLIHALFFYMNYVNLLISMPCELCCRTPKVTNEILAQI